jgi:hypothetical protein
MRPSRARRRGAALFSRDLIMLSHDLTTTSSPA